MPDDPNKRGPQDRSRINVNEPWELRYWSEKLGVTADQLTEAVRQVGPNVEAVEQHLARQHTSQKP